MPCINAPMPETTFTNAAARESAPEETTATAGTTWAIPFDV